MKAKIKQLQEDVGVVMKGQSQEVLMSAAPTSWEMVKKHDKLYQQCYSWLRDAKGSNVKPKATILRAQNAERAAKGAINKLLGP